MNLTAAIMLVNDGVRPVKVEYDPENFKNNNPNKLFKTLDASIKKDDLVIVPTGTRHGFTIAKVIEVDFAVDFSDSSPWGWIGGKFDKATYDEMLKIEDTVKHTVAKAQENKMRAELIEAAGLGRVDFGSVMAALRPPVSAKPAEIQGIGAPPAPQPKRDAYGKRDFDPPSSPLDDEIPF